MVRRTFFLSSALVAALSVALAATPEFADASARTHVVSASAQHLRAHAGTSIRTLSANVVTPGTAPTLLQSQPGLSEQAAIAAAGAGNPAVTTPADPSIAVGPNNIVEAVNSGPFSSAR